jgi:Asp-tRNA(Asn)/Glu-tRNA(Gln) amidotransferase A subunit family amidase
MTSGVLPATDLPLTISDAVTALRTGKLTATSLVEALIARADRLDPEIGCYLARTDEAALAAAAATADAPTTAQSLVLNRSFGARGDAPVVARLCAAGGVITGKVTTMGSRRHRRAETPVLRGHGSARRHRPGGLTRHRVPPDTGRPGPG